ncbi:hypothetical protein [Sphingobacterium bovistauri]|uniref:Uncharacterized protein n=1 Tax=Sphingobacterium bovistauri TaxID=2781959 RepID=A0ABS7ZAI8_9SPHI|nr:hypothetical protein [Sphingobacterium bovistauri]MCA5005875.1 hypothetical protein [Sphingobacterium bovistauri]
MKRLLIIIASAFVLASCQKDEEITPVLQFENIYAIIDNPNDSVQHRTYNIYKEFGVPVYFNDTIGRVHVMDDVQGNPIYNYEKIDLSWSFHSYNKNTYEFDYMTDDKQKMKALDIIETYLKDASPSLRPFSFFVTNSTRMYNQGVLSTTYRNSTFNIGFRTILMTGNWTAKQLADQPGLMKRQMVLSKITNYVEDVALFSSVSKSVWYGGLGWEKIYDPKGLQFVIGWRDMEMLYDDWSGARWYTAEELEIMRNNARTVAGSFGFIKGNHTTKGLETPSNATYDLQDYVIETLKYSPEEFEQIWGKYPLVMKKYGIVRNIIENKLLIKL